MLSCCGNLKVRYSAHGCHAEDLPEVYLAEVHLALARELVEQWVGPGAAPLPLSCHLLPAGPRVALDRRVAAEVAVPVPRPHAEPRRGVACMR